MVIQRAVLYITQTRSQEIFIEIRQLYFISINYGRWICAIQFLKHGDTFVLSIIDVFEKIGFARSLKDKKGPTVLKAFLNVLEESGRMPD